MTTPPTFSGTNNPTLPGARRPNLVQPEANQQAGPANAPEANQIGKPNKPAKITIEYSNGHTKTFSIIVKKTSTQGLIPVNQITNSSLTSYYIGQSFRYGLSALRCQHGIEMKDVDFNNVKLIRKQKEKLKGEKIATKKLYLVYTDKKNKDEDGKAKTYEVEIIQDLELEPGDQKKANEIKLAKNDTTSDKFENINTVIKCYRAALDTLKDQTLDLQGEPEKAKENFTIKLEKLPDLNEKAKKHYEDKRTKAEEEGDDKKTQSDDNNNSSSNTVDNVKNKDAATSSQTPDSSDKAQTDASSSASSSTSATSSEGLDKEEKEGMSSYLELTTKEKELFKDNKKVFPDISNGTHNGTQNGQPNEGTGPNPCKEYLLEGKLYSDPGATNQTGTVPAVIRTSNVKITEERANELIKSFITAEDNKIFKEENDTIELCDSLSNEDKIFIKRLNVLLARYLESNNSLSNNVNVVDIIRFQSTYVYNYIFNKDQNDRCPSQSCSNKYAPFFVKKIEELKKEVQ